MNSKLLSVAVFLTLMLTSWGYLHISPKYITLC